MAKKRKQEISVLNIIFCLLVIFIHCISYAVSSFAPPSLSYIAVMLPWRLVSFVVPGFLLLSGVKLFVTGKDSLSYGAYIKGRIRGVLLPYAVAFSVYYLAFMAVYAYPADILFMTKHFLLGSLVYHLYFIPLLFQFDLLFPLWKRIIPRVPPVILIPFALCFSQLCENYLPALLSAAFPSLSLPYNDRLFTSYLVYFVAGCYIGRYYEAFCEMLRRNFRAICVLFAFCFCLTGYYSYLAFGGLAAVPAMNQIHGLYVLSACLFLYALAIKIPAGTIEKAPLLSKIDSASFYIYLYHVLVLFGADKLIEIMGIQAQGAAFAIRALLSYTIAPLFCILYVEIKKRRAKQKEG